MEKPQHTKIHLVALLNVYHFIPPERTAEIISELYQQDISHGTVFAATVELAEKVAPITEQLKKSIWWRRTARSISLT